MTGHGPDCASVADPGDPADGEALLNRMHRTLWRYAALCGLAELGVPGQLADGPLPVTELARRLGVHAPTLARVLRTAATTGLLRTAGPDACELTGAGTALLRGTERQRLTWNSDPGIWAALAQVGETIRSGRSPFAREYGGTYGYLATRPRAAEAFDTFMAARSAPAAGLVAQSGVFPLSGTVADLGGGRGTFLAAILRANPALRGILLDLERVTGSARHYLEQAGVAGRCEVIAGDFFTAVPAADIYLLAHVLHNWDDEGAAQILRTVRAAIPAAGRLLVIETPVPPGDQPHLVKDLEIRLMTIEAGGRERTRAEYAALLRAAGFRLDQVTSGMAGRSLMAASPATA